MSFQIFRQLYISALLRVTFVLYRGGRALKGRRIKFHQHSTQSSPGGDSSPLAEFSGTLHAPPTLHTHLLLQVIYVRFPPAMLSSRHSPITTWGGLKHRTASILAGKWLTQACWRHHICCFGSLQNAHHVAVSKGLMPTTAGGVQASAATQLSPLLPVDC